MKRCSFTLLCLALSCQVLGCGKAEEPVYAGDTTVPLKEIGTSCGATEECRPGLACVDTGTCQPAGTQKIGQPCITSAECVDNAYCGFVSHCVDDQGDEHHFKENTGCLTDGDCRAELGSAEYRCMIDIPAGQTCVKQGTGEAGAVCATDADCKAGLYCKLIGLTGICSPGGTGAPGAKCDEAADCHPGLVCGSGDVCTSWAEELLESALWETPCAADEPGNPRVFFEIPGADGHPKGDFYRLPFPNDIRMESGLVAVGHPVPGKGPLDFDPVQRVIDAVNTGLNGFGTTPTVFFRFSTKLDFGTVDYSDDGTPPNLRYVNIDKGSPLYKHPKGYAWAAGDGRGGKYLCQNWLTVRNHWSDPLEPATTYAVLLLKGMLAAETGEAFGADADLQKLLSSVPAGLPHNAWDKYQPLRDYLADEGISPDKVIAAAVFTTGVPHAIMGPAREVVRALDPPVISGVVMCGPGVTSPCEEGDDASRRCTDNPAFYEIHGKIRLPAFQKGNPPYLTPADGGTIKVGAGNAPEVDRLEDICFSLTIPKSSPTPAGGWPVVLFAHGTGGNFRSHAANGVAQMLSTITAGAGEKGAAVLGIDGVAHGPRRASQIDPETLFYNFANPAAARANVYQGAIEYFSLVRFVEQFSGNLSSLVGVDFDGQRIAFLGHSQGSTTGALFAAFEANVRTVVLSGAGAGLTESLLHKTSPVNVPAGVEAVLREKASVTHPVLSLMQQFFDPVDSINYARQLALSPPEGVPPKNLLVLYGQGDTFTPPGTTRILADALKLNVMAPALDVGPGEPFDGYQAKAGGDPETDRVVEGPIENEAQVGGEWVTQGMTHYAPDGYDGHFVLTRNATAQKQVGSFFGTWFEKGAATIVLP